MRAAVLVAGWLGAFCAATFFGVSLSLPARIAICVGVATFGSTGIRTCFLFAGRNSVRTLNWVDDSLIARCGPLRVEKPVELAGGSFRLGQLGWLLWLKGRDGSHPLFIDAGLQDICAIRRLARHLEWARLRQHRAGESGKLIPSDPKV